MAGKSGKWAQQESEAPKVAYCGYAVVVKEPSSYSYESSNEVQPWQGQHSSSYQTTSRNNIVDKQTGSYMRSTFKESSSTGDVFKERSTGRVGYKDEYKTTTTTKIGDKSGYYEYQREDRYRRVNFEDSSSGSKGRNSYARNKNYLK